SSGIPSNLTGKNDVYAGMFRLSYLFNWASPVEVLIQGSISSELKAPASSGAFRIPLRANR
ncbi:hypothetical protein, partial [Bradyrhizobium sp.]|uniref:hypothetical protein n=1 Tax=Bradyrhizobium sp. TaxID=376 RepID=UPI003D0A3E5E